MPTRTAKDSRTNTGSLAITSNSFTPSNTSLLIVMATYQPPGAHTVNPATDIGITDTAGLTWTPRANLKHSAAANNFTPVGRVWTAPVTTGVSMTVTCTVGGVSSNDGATITVVQYTGHDTASPIGVTAGADVGTAAGPTDGAQSITLSGAPASTSEICGGLMIGDSGGTAFDASAGSGITKIYAIQPSAGLQGHQIECRAAGSTSTTFDWTDVWVTGGDSGYEAYGWALEIKDVGGGGTALDVPLLRPPPQLNVHRM